MGSPENGTFDSSTSDVVSLKCIRNSKRKVTADPVLLSGNSLSTRLVESSALNFESSTVSVGGSVSSDSNSSLETANPRKRSISPLSQNSNTVHLSNLHESSKISSPPHNEEIKPILSVDKITHQTGDFTRGRGALHVPMHTSKKPRIEYTIPAASIPGPILLARPRDSDVLSPLHVFVRQQIEVFAATKTETIQPAPGRKHRVKLNQVGLRCIHCCSLPPRDRGKRAACYPSSVGRIYHSVSDMKFDHFGICKGISPLLRARFNELKEKKKQRPKTMGASSSSRKASSTAQYYHDSARKLGLVDVDGALFMENISSVKSRNELRPIPILPKTGKEFRQDRSHFIPDFKNVSKGRETTAPLESNLLMQNLLTFHHQIHTSNVCPLASKLDIYHLNPLHCFIRHHIEVFCANENDIAAPHPGRRTRVTLGQVGIRCMHCTRVPPKDRVKRAVCYPPSVAGIYHSVSNMKFDHFSVCRALPETDKQRFNMLRASCGRHGPRIGKGKMPNKNSTAQFYHDSAVQLGLVDSVSGIRFRTNTATIPRIATETPQEDARNDGISALMIAASVRAAGIVNKGLQTNCSIQYLPV